MTPPARAAAPGHAYERTDMAWSRTAASIVIGGVLLTRLATIEGSGPGLMTGLALAAAGLLFLTHQGRRQLGIRGDRPAEATALVAVAVAAVVLGTAGAVIVLASLW